jgi:iron-sulfur cluster insertion protein
MIKLTEAAIEKIKSILAEENNPALKLRMFVQGGGCSGFQYGFSLDDQQNDDDYEIAQGDIIVLVDAMSAQYVQGAEIDHTEDFLSSEFKINNPKAQSTCGCGNSFSAYPGWDI